VRLAGKQPSALAPNIPETNLLYVLLSATSFKLRIMSNPAQKNGYKKLCESWLLPSHVSDVVRGAPPWFID